MKRLLETSGGGPAVERARELLQSMDRIPDDEVRQRRVRARLEGAHPVPARRRRRVTWVAAAIVLFVGVAGATAGTRSWWSNVPAGSPAVPAESQSPPGASAATTSTLERVQPDLPPPPPTAESELAGGEEDISTELPPKNSSPRRAGSEPPRTNAPAKLPPREASPADELAASDVAIIHEAAKALRGEGNPNRAAQLLETLPTTSQGPLAEEALALRIEAALAKGNPVAAAAYGRQYLSRYPSGRYRRLATRAVEACANQ